MAKHIVGVVGNPNCGKTTLFNALTGSKQRVGNWPGVTVDKKTGFFSHKNEGAYELDRDWISDLGNAVENIYTVSDDITPGEYQVKVHHYSGVLGKRYNCRVIMDGVLVKSVTGEISVNKEFDDIYTFTVE